MWYADLSLKGLLMNIRRMISTWMLGLACAMAALGAAEPMPIGAARGLSGEAREVTVRGVVHTIFSADPDTGAARGLFMIQNTPADADGDAATPDGILIALSGAVADEAAVKDDSVVAAAAAPAEERPRLGDEVVVRGRVGMASGSMRILNARILEQVRRDVDLDREIETGVVGPPDNEADARLWWVARDGMRVRIPAGSQALGPVKGWAGVPRGEWPLVAAGHPLLTREDPHARRLFRRAHPLRHAAGHGMIIQALPPPAGRDAPVFAPRTFDRLAADATGGAWVRGNRSLVVLHQTPALERGPDPADLAPPPPAPSDRPRLSVVTFNVENLFDHVDDPFDTEDFADRRGRRFNYVPASEAEYRTRLTGLARQIVQDLGAPDVLMLQEVEDQDILPVAPGAALRDNADGVPDALADLAEEIARQGGPRYAAGAGRAGADGRGIICAYMWRPDRVRPAPVAGDDPLLGTDPQAALTPGEGRLILHDPGPGPVRSLNLTDSKAGRIMRRGVQVLAVLPADETLVVPPVYLLNNHFKARPQSFLDERRAQAEFNARLVRALLERDPGARVVVGGDLNTFPRPDDAVPENPVDTLAPLYDAGMYNLYGDLMRRLPAGTYTYLWEGMAQTLDHLFVSPALRRQRTDVRVAHINADHTYAAAAPHRGVGDHDPILAVFEWVQKEDGR
jgi:uncharacterized protein